MWAPLQQACLWACLQWRTMVYQVLFIPTLIFVSFFFINTTALIYGSTMALPFRTSPQRDAWNEKERGSALISALSPSAQSKTNWFVEGGRSMLLLLKKMACMALVPELEPCEEWFENQTLRCIDQTLSQRYGCKWSACEVCFAFLACPTFCTGALLKQERPKLVAVAAWCCCFYHRPVFSWTPHSDCIEVLLCMFRRTPRFSNSNLWAENSMGWCQTWKRVPDNLYPSLTLSQQEAIF